MTASVATPIPPIHRSIDVSWNPDAAFRRFTTDFAKWWPHSSHSVGGKLVKQIVFECQSGGRIYEELKDGRRFLWGKITAWDPPKRVAFTWHPSMEASMAQDVEVRFNAEGTGTQVELISSGWERLGEKGKGMRKGYDLGWGSVLSTYADRWSLVMLIFTAISRALTLGLRLTGRLDAEINKAGGKMPAESASSAIARTR